MLNVLSVLKAEIGDLDRVKSCVKILVFVASANDFYTWVLAGFKLKPHGFKSQAGFGWLLVPALWF